MNKAVTLYRAEDTFSSVPVLRLTVSSFQNYPAKSSDAGLEGGCFFSAIASVRLRKLPWVSWLHIRRMNELSWKTNSLQRGMCFPPHFFRVKYLRGLMPLNPDVKLSGLGSGGRPDTSRIQPNNVWFDADIRIKLTQLNIVRYLFVDINDWSHNQCFPDEAVLSKLTRSKMMWVNSSDEFSEGVLCLREIIDKWLIRWSVVIGTSYRQCGINCKLRLQEQCEGHSCSLTATARVSNPHDTNIAHKLWISCNILLIYLMFVGTCLI